MELFYYTTTETMKCIVTKGDIYATNVRYLNDTDEYINGLREIRSLLLSADKYGFDDLKQQAEAFITQETYQEIEGQISDIYSISFSKASDLLSQWHMYARESGVQIKMCFDGKSKGEYYCPILDKSGEKGTKKLEKKPVYYFTKIGMPLAEYEETGRKILDEFAQILHKNDEIVSTWKVLAPFIKNYGFVQEQEVRAIFLANETGLPIGYRGDRGVLKPYLDIEMKKGWPICGIMVGPGRNQNQVFQSLCHFFEHTDLKIDRVEAHDLVRMYFDGMREYYISNQKVDECIERVIEMDQKMTMYGVRYSEKIQETLKAVLTEEGERRIVKEYTGNNFFCEKGIIVNKSKWPYEF